MYIIANNILKILYFFLLLAFISGLFTVSAGAYSAKLNKHIIDTIMKNILGNMIFLHINGIPIKAILEDIQHQILFEACIPKANALRKLKISKPRLNKKMRVSERLWDDPGKEA